VRRREDIRLTPQQFIDEIAPAAVLFYCAHKISAALIIAQGALESGWGKTTKAMGNNLFGLKADPSWHGPTTLQDTKEYVNGQWITVKARFRAYPSIQACLEDHDGFLLQPRYQNLMGADYQIACHLIAAVDHYATDPTYEKQLLDIISEHNLVQYDKEVQTMMYAPVKAMYGDKQYPAIDVNNCTYASWTLARDAGLNLTKVAFGDVEIDGKKPRQVTQDQNTFICYEDLHGVHPVRLADNAGWEFVKDAPPFVEPADIKSDPNEQAIAWALQNGLMAVGQDGDFHPGDTVSRSEVADSLQKLADLLKK